MAKKTFKTQSYNNAKFGTKIEKTQEINKQNTNYHAAVAEMYDKLKHKGD